MADDEVAEVGPRPVLQGLHPPPSFDAHIQVRVHYIQYIGVLPGEVTVLPSVHSEVIKMVYWNWKGGGGDKEGVKTGPPQLVNFLDPF